MKVYKKTVPKETGTNRFKRFVWEGLKKGDTVVPVSVPGVSSMYFQVIGTHGMVAIEGSLEEVPENYFMLTDNTGMPMYLQDGVGMAVPYPGVMHVRPHVDDGDEDTEFTVIMFTRSN